MHSNQGSPTSTKMQARLSGHDHGLRTPIAAIAAHLVDSPAAGVLIEAN